MNIIIRTDSSAQIGTGHLMRCLTLAETLREKGAKVSFICRDLPGNLSHLIAKKEFEVFTLPYNKEIWTLSPGNNYGIPHASWLGTSWEIDLEQTISIVKRKREVDGLIIDHYALDHRWETQVRPNVKKIIVIDDLADRRHNCDLLLDQNIYEDMETRYNGLASKQTEKLLGPKYALLRPEFIKERINLRERDGIIRRILIFFGGNDPTNETTKTLKAIQALNQFKLWVDVVVGSTNLHKQQIKKICDGTSNFNFYCQVENIAQLIHKADFSIGAGGTTTWERCCLGLPSLVISVAHNQEAIAKAIDQKGAAIYLGTAKETNILKIREKLNKLFANPEKVLKMSKRAKTLVDGQGVMRVSEAIIQ